MATEKQIAANRRNAAKSTGPKSEAGKEIARMNAAKHGMQAKHVVLPGEDPREFEALVRGLEEHLLPVGPLETSLVARIADCTWCLQRARLIEAAMMRREHHKLKSARAKGDMKRASDTMRWVQNVFDYEGGDEEEQESVSDRHNLSAEEAKDLERRYDEAEETYQRANETHEEAEEQLANTSDVLDLVVVIQTRSDSYQFLRRFLSGPV